MHFSTNNVHFGSSSSNVRFSNYLLILVADLLVTHQLLYFRNLSPPRFFPSSLLLARPLFQSPSLSAQGDNSEGQTGVVNETMVFSPPVVPVLTAVLAVATGQDFTCALRRGAPREYVVAISHLSSRAVVWKRTRALARALVLVMNTDTLLPIVLLFVCLQGVACFALGPTIWGS